MRVFWINVFLKCNDPKHAGGMQDGNTCRVATYAVIAENVREAKQRALEQCSYIVKGFILITTPMLWELVHVGVQNPEGDPLSDVIPISNHDLTEGAVNAIKLSDLEGREAA